MLLNDLIKFALQICLKKQINHISNVLIKFITLIIHSYYAISSFFLH